MASNISNKAKENQNLLLENQIIPHLHDLYNRATDQKLKYSIIGCFSNILSGRSIGIQKYSEKLIPILISVLKETTNPEILLDALFCLSYLAEEKEIGKQMVKYVTSFKITINNEFYEIICSTLQILSSILLIPENIPKVFKEIPIQLFSNLLDSQNFFIQKYISLFFYTITLKYNSYITNEHITKLCKLANKHNLALLTLANLARNNENQIKLLINSPAIDLFIKCLNTNSEEYIYFAAEALNNILDSTHKDLIKKKIDIQKIEKLHLHPNEEIFNYANQIFSKLNNN
ncbi:importin subunit alpha-7 [Anaeramoeba flamelloides]|uniref:Importin subunit alpha-7 n=1 Tax=Anaeramoeba flamelloides TaxID=1746091 RepID=A0ABQ8XRH2_9EUKA|nr:importin subunit alpha-7 [Anaeramoeba flamelloides]